jgi:hypothetical protein
MTKCRPEEHSPNRNCESILNDFIDDRVAVRVWAQRNLAVPIMKWPNVGLECCARICGFNCPFDDDVIAWRKPRRRRVEWYSVSVF